ncbi:formimidoylglutamate deiminase [Microbacterium thalassium]|uniref:Formiminoglutamate deiminase n=1 Tax=Microbacterium thalassium TaxID=362649 RepID=A0A7X0FLK6_9MICO|nr:formimidoylglutamate deiminase [Microbacterium thalassium]MBB6389699.1 formiminoglutamate deiminase [Microbacterium thalassium]GLK24750.1 formimidoylglutamate deiminase [Microbacterium thalassium]
MTIHCEAALVDGVVEAGVRLDADADGRIDGVALGVAPQPGDLRLGFALPGIGNAHSHAFHRVLRARTHDDGGDFWRWREQMYAAAARLDPERYHDLALGVFAEMLAAGWTAVGEFHYVHHRPDGSPYDPAHAMELALAEAARSVGIRLTLLDTCYLTGGIGKPPSPDQRRFGDGTPARWLARWESLRDALPADTVLGAAVHSVRAVAPDDITEIVRALPADVPLHVHLSEQPQENEDCVRAHGLTPTGVLDRAGALSPRLSAVHATHLAEDDIRMLGDAGVTIAMCPTTEADLGDGIGPARRLADAGARIALGSDQNAVVDPFLEARGLEAGERLASGRRGRFGPAALTDALTASGYASLGLTGGIRRGALCDLVEVDTASVRTVGADLAQIALAATASDVQRVVVGGTVRAASGALAPAGAGRRRGTEPARLLADALAAFPLPSAKE